MNKDLWDVAVVGAGFSGLTCAMALQEAGYRVIVIEKSKGIGGRVATRRIENICVDHGAPTLSSSPADHAQYKAFIASMLQKDLIQPWPQENIYRAMPGFEQWQIEKSPSNPETTVYTAAAGMTAIAKNFAGNLKIVRSQRVKLLTLNSSSQSYWQLFTESTDQSIQSIAVSAKAVVLAIPAPQAIDLYRPLVKDEQSQALLEVLGNVVFNPCITVMAGYSAEHPLSWSELLPIQDPIIERVICDSQKRSTPKETWLVIHSAPTFAARFLEDFDVAGQQMLNYLGKKCESWMAYPSELQLHVWRYGNAEEGYPGRALMTSLEQPFWICGEWIEGSSIEDAIKVGFVVAQQLKRHFKE